MKIKVQHLALLFLMLVSTTVFGQDNPNYEPLGDEDAIAISKEDALYNVFRLKGLIIPVAGEDGKMKYVLRAKDVERHMPHAITRLPSGEVKIDYEQVIPFLAEAMQELVLRLEDVEQENSRLREEAANESIRISNELRVLLYDVATLKAQLTDLYPPVTEESTEVK